MGGGLWGRFEKSVFGAASIPSEGANLPDATEPAPPLPLQQVQEQKWGARWRRFLQLQASVAARSFGSTPYPAIVLNLFGVENYFPEERVGWFASVVGAGGAGNFTYVGLSNPAGSGLLVIVSYISAFPTGATNLQLATEVVGVTATGTTFARDARDPAWVGNFAVPLFISDNTHAVANGGGNGPVQIKAAAGATSVVEWTGSGETGFAVISPGHNLAVVAGTANIGVTAEFRFRTIPQPKL